MDDLIPLTTAEKIPHGLKKPTDGFSRQDVVNAIQRAFIRVGGVDRLTLWANDNYSDFIKLYARLLPSQTVVIGEQAVQKIVHALPPTPLDVHPGQTIDAATGELVPTEREPCE